MTSAPLSDRPYITEDGRRLLEARIRDRERTLEELRAAIQEPERSGDDAARLAVDVFCYRIRKQIGAHLAALGGAEAIFGGGIGERSPTCRARVCADTAWCGVELDDERNQNAIGVEAEISTARAMVSTWVIPVDEATFIARDATTCLVGSSPTRR
jgi:acetate kinase